jgi:hypothetical protein
MSERLPGELPPYDLPEVEPTDPVHVFIVSRNTTTPQRRVLWRMTRADAELVCSDPRTAGENYGLHWSAEGLDDEEANTFVADDGRFDGVLAEYGVLILDCKQYEEDQR